MRGGVDDQIPIGQDRGALTAPPTYECLSPQRELPRTEWLGDVVVGPGLKAPDPIRLIRQGGDHHDGHLRDGPDPLSHGHPGDCRNHEIQNHQVEGALFEQGPGLSAVGRADDDETRGLQGETHDHEDLRLVIDDEDPGCP